MHVYNSSPKIGMLGGMARQLSETIDQQTEKNAASKLNEAKSKSTSSCT